MGIDAKQFMQVAVPYLQQCDATALVQAISARWTVADICDLLVDGDVDARRVAAVTAGLVGDPSAIPCLAAALRDVDAQVNQMAEHALWSLWFRGGNPRAASPFREGVAMLAEEKYANAAACFAESARIDPRFAEAYNQDAIAHFFLGQYHKAINNCGRAIQLIPQHFGAISGMGHCYTQLGQLDQALCCYRQALDINPRMAVIERACQRIEARLRERNDSSGMHLAGVS